MKRLTLAVLILISIFVAVQFTGCSSSSAPITVVSVNKYIDTKGSQQLNVIIKNTSEKNTVASAQVYVKCYNSRNTLLTDTDSGQSLYACTYTDCNLAPGQLTPDNLFFDYSGFDEIIYCQIAVKSATLSDGNRYYNRYF